MLLQVHPDNFGLWAVYAGCDFVPGVCPTKQLLWFTFGERWLYQGVWDPKLLHDVTGKWKTGGLHGKVL